ncbi:MAG: NifU family protein [Bacteroidota bacterium]
MSDYNRQDWIIKVDKALDSVRPHLAIDGGNVEVVDVTEDLTVKVKWLGSCVGCSMSQMTMKAGLEQTLKTTVPEVKAVEAVN